MEKYYEHLAELEKGKTAEPAGTYKIKDFSKLEKEIEELEEE